MQKTISLEDMLSAWGETFGGSKYENIGWKNISPMGEMMKWGGRSPDGSTGPISSDVAEDIQKAYMSLRRQDQGFIPSQALLLEYGFPAYSLDMKLEKLREMGRDTSRAMWRQHLRVARIYVAGWLRVPFADGDK